MWTVTFSSSSSTLASLSTITTQPCHALPTHQQASRHLCHFTLRCILCAHKLPLIAFAYFFTRPSIAAPICILPCESGLIASSRRHIPFGHSTIRPFASAYRHLSSPGTRGFRLIYDIGLSSSSLPNLFSRLDTRFDTRFDIPLTILHISLPQQSSAHVPRIYSLRLHTSSYDFISSRNSTTLHSILDPGPDSPRPLTYSATDSCSQSIQSIAPSLYYKKLCVSYSCTLASSFKQSAIYIAIPRSTTTDNLHTASPSSSPANHSVNHQPLHVLALYLLLFCLPLIAYFPLPIAVAYFTFLAPWTVPLVCPFEPV